LKFYHVQELGAAMVMRESPTENAERYSKSDVDFIWFTDKNLREWSCLCADCVKKETGCT